MKMSEAELVRALQTKRQERDSMEESLKVLKEEVIELETQLIEALNAEGKDATARYEGIGYFSLSKPQLFASYKKENEEEVFQFVRDAGREDLIKPTIHSRSLSSYVSELVETGKKIPDCLTYYLKPMIKFYKEK